MWDLKTLAKINFERAEYLKKKKAEKEAIKNLAEDLKSSPRPKGR